MLNLSQLYRVMDLWKVRGKALADQGSALAILLDQSPVDITAILGPALLLSQGYARAQVETIASICRQQDFPLGQLPLDRQIALLTLATQWGQLRATLGTFAFTRKLPTFAALLASTPEGIRFGGNAAGVALSITLESLADVAGVAGITPMTFWGLSDSARASLGRLAILDLALGTSPEIDTLSEAEHLLRYGEPLAPDPISLIRDLEAAKVPRYSERPVTRTESFAVPDNTTIQTLAKIVGGDAEKWRDLVTYNNLRYPYISSDPLDQLGDRQGELTLHQGSPSGTRTLTVDDASALYLDQRLRIDVGDQAALYTIEAVDRSTGVVTLTEALAYDVPTTAVVWVYAPVYDVLGRVLVPGDRLLVPIQTGTSNSGRIRLGESTAEGVYGIDVAVSTRGRLSLDDGDLARVAGIPNLTQALRHRLIVPRGSLTQHPRYGTGLHAMLGRLASAYSEFLGIVESRQTLLRDPRVARIESLTLTQEADTMRIEVSAVTSQGEQFPPTSLAVAVGR